MFDGSPCYALQGSDGQAMLLQTEQLVLKAVNDIRKLRVQSRPDAGINPARFESLTGIVLPTGSREKTDHDRTIYWLAPNDWLLVNPTADADDIKSALRDSASGSTTIVTDVTDAWSIIDISCEGAIAKLAEGCSVEFHDEVFPSGRYALTRLQHLSVIIHRLDNTPRFRILVDRSVARFLWDWLNCLWGRTSICI
jgi:sarcosine oxidase subunit gamma